MYTCFIINLYFNYNIYVPQLYEALQKLQKKKTTDCKVWADIFVVMFTNNK